MARVYYKARRYRRAHFNVELGRWIYDRRVKRPLFSRRFELLRERREASRKKQKPKYRKTDKITEQILSGNNEVSGDMLKVYTSTNLKDFVPVYPIHVTEKYFVYLDNSTHNAHNQVESSRYCVAHIEKGLTIWAAFLSLSHAKEFAEWMDENIGDNFMRASRLEDIKNQLIFMGYRPLTKR